ncbi:hypothetical protein EDB81DRAFT_926799 [Dactylonectria macrodidyma]|uniref:Xylanolytic transcriptional activator regulatory domain-containing protein n=1 Tax=Dactylonectria macrodidyma TaxID=307937 RepID=A0A9P9D1G2_9HYPO|nr:hypothetical protein EDB81DRAFT_926799 [Dactylonectria macrodidyma]
MSKPQSLIVWTPSEHDLTKSPLARFRDIVNQKYGLRLKSYHDLHGWSGPLYRNVEILAGAMRVYGVSEGDRVVAIVETSGLAIALCLATLSIGAIWSSLSPDFGSRGTLDRLVQINPTLVFTDTAVNYNGKARDIIPTIREWAKAVSCMDSVRNIVLHVKDTGLESKFPKVIDLESFKQGRSGRTLEFEQLPFACPAFIFYSSGTTGAPKCDGQQPCRNCVDHDESCAYAALQRTRSRKADVSNAMAERLSRVEALLLAAGDSSPISTSFSVRNGEIDDSMSRSRRISTSQHPVQDTQLLSPIFSQRSTSPRSIGASPMRNLVTEIQATEVADSSSEKDSSRYEASSHGLVRTGMLQDSRRLCSMSSQSTVENRRRTSLVASLPSPSTILTGELLGSAPTLSSQDVASDAAINSPEANSVYSGELSNWEYHGPRSFLSICSTSGVQWVCSKTGGPAFTEFASRLSRDITRRLKIDTNDIKDRTTGPSPELAWKYVTAYFERSREAPFELVDRASFECRLKNHLAGQVKNEDPAWYALRNAIYATGCRLELSKTGNFRDAFHTAWGFFSNCLAVHLELLYFRTSMMAIQALTVMGYFTESIGNPCLEYMLSTVALRLACSKGLHRQAVSSWNMSQDEKQLRNRIFWAAYCLEKNCAARSGRPSVRRELSLLFPSHMLNAYHYMIDDDQISCPLPHTEPTDDSLVPKYSLALIKLAQMSSLTAKRLNHIETQQQSAAFLVETVGELDQKLKTLQRFVQQLVDLNSPLESCKPGADIDLQQAVYLRMAYYIAVLDVHTPLTYPWSQRLFNLAGSPDLRSQVQTSLDIVIQTARRAILATQFVRLDATTSILMGFQGPLYALINMFVYILEDTQRSTVQSDLALFDIGASHFLRLEFNTESEVSFHFAKELASLARRAIDSSNTSLETSADGGSVLNNSAGVLLDSEGHGGVPGFNDLADPLRDAFPPSFLGLDFEHCSTFLPTPDFDDCTMNVLY